MRRVARVLGAALLLAAAVFGGFQAWKVFRTVDGMNAGGWLEFAGAASRIATYHGEGRTTANGVEATFVLDQGEAGRYAMHVTGADGRECALGNDGDQIWYRTGKQLTRATAPEDLGAPLRMRSRISGLGIAAGRMAVILRVESGAVLKELALDRRTGVVLAMNTSFRGKELSRMSLDRIAYQPVFVTRCVEKDAPEIRVATPGEVDGLLKRAALLPRSLPDGFTLRGTFVQRCDCCLKDMAALRYSDGLRSITLFEMPGRLTCAMREGCEMVPDGSALVDSRKVGGVTVVAVGNVERTVLEEALTSLM